MSSAVLHYLYDPLCGWCWGAAPLVRAARAVMPVQLHAGGLMTGVRRQQVTPELRAFVQPHDERIAQLSGQPFGSAYRDGLLTDTEAVFDSEPPTAAVLAAEALAGRGLDMLARVQTAHYVEGQRIADADVLLRLAVGLGLAQPAFAAELARQASGPVQAHVQQTRAFMAASGARGFPSFVLQGPQGSQLLDATAYLGRPEAFAAVLAEQLGQPGLAAATPSPGGASCSADGCRV